MEKQECSISNDKDAEYQICCNIKSDEEIIIIVNENVDEDIPQETTSDDEKPLALFEPKIEINEIQSDIYKDLKNSQNKNEIKPFACTDCTKVFSLQSTLNRHILRHSETKPYTCNLCGASFRFKHYLASHKMRHNKKLFLCELCGSKFRLQNDLKAHKRSHKRKSRNKENPPVNLLKNEDVGLNINDNIGGHDINETNVTNSDDDLIEANDDKETPKILEIKTSNDIIFKCSLCPKVFRKRRYIKDHILVHSGDKPFICQECGTGFSQKGTLNRHMLQHSDLKPYKCDICNAAFKLKHYLTSHYLTHTTDRPYACDSCVSTFARKYDLDAHIRQKHLRVQKFQCDKCGQQFTRRKHLNMHLVVHAKNTGPQCHVCWKFFKNEERLNLHRRFHLASELGNHKCHICEAVFTRHTYLSKHLAKHSVVDYVKRESSDKLKLSKRFSCATCNGLFSSKALVTEHNKVHIADMPFPCTVCHKRFRRRSNLISHSYLHTGVKNHKCGGCPKRFSQKHLLKQHMQKHGHSLACILCDETFKAFKELKKHVLEAHGIDSVSCIVEINAEAEGLIDDVEDP